MPEAFLILQKSPAGGPAGEASEADHAQMLKQNLQADQNQDDAACQLCLRLVAQAEEIADPKSGGGTSNAGGIWAAQS